MTRAVVLGAGFGGLIAAASLRTGVDEVLLIERDHLPVSPEPRRGVPQATQLHNLLAAAQLHAEDVLPGFLARMVQAGAVRARVSSETYVHELGLRMPERDLGLALMCARRPLLEQVARDLLLENERVRIHHAVSAVGLALDDGAARGVAVRSADGTLAEVLTADLVVDAMGSSSATAQWLGDAGYDVPKEGLRVEQWYATAICRRPPSLRGSCRFWLVFPTPPSTRGGLVSPVEDDYFHVSLNGRAGDTPPRTHAEFVAYAASLEDPVLGDLLAECEPVHGPALFRVRNATWRHFERMDRPVAGLLPVGDAVATLNPLFGQGMSVVATQAAALAEHLGTEGVGDIPALSARHRASAAAAVRMAWDLGALVDPGHDGWQRSISDPVYAAALNRLLRDDPDVHRRYVSIWHLLEPAAALDSTDVMEKIRHGAAALAAGRGRGGDIVLDR